MLPAIWFWSSQLHWDEVCSAGDKDSTHGAAQEVHLCQGTGHRGNIFSISNLPLAIYFIHPGSSTDRASYYHGSKEWNLPESDQSYINCAGG